MLLVMESRPPHFLLQMKTRPCITLVNGDRWRGAICCRAHLVREKSRVSKIPWQMGNWRSYDKNPASSQYRPCLRVLSWRSLLRRSCILTVLGLTREASVDRQRYYKTTLNLSRSTKSPFLVFFFDFFNVYVITEQLSEVQESLLGNRPYF